MNSGHFQLPLSLRTAEKTAMQGRYSNTNARKEAAVSGVNACAGSTKTESVLTTTSLAEIPAKRLMPIFQSKPNGCRAGSMNRPMVPR